MELSIECNLFPLQQSAAKNYQQKTSKRNVICLETNYFQLYKTNKTKTKTNNKKPQHPKAPKQP